MSKITDADFIKAMAPALPAVGTATASPSKPCKGFWNFCGCATCRAQDKELEKSITEGTREERRAALAEGMAAVMLEKGIKP